MTLCPVAIGVGCKKCPVFNMCPLKSVIGDHVADAVKAAAEKAKAEGKSSRH